MSELINFSMDNEKEIMRRSEVLFDPSNHTSSKLNDQNKINNSSFSNWWKQDKSSFQLFLNPDNLTSFQPSDILSK